MSHFHEQSDDELAEFAARVFKLGLIDGRTLTKPRGGHEVMSAITALQDDYRVIDRMKYRQVYGAGFDLSSVPRKAAATARARAQQR